MLPGCHWIGLGSFFIGLVETFLYGAYSGLVFGVVYNAVQRRRSVRRLGELPT